MEIVSLTENEEEIMGKVFMLRNKRIKTILKILFIIAVAFVFYRNCISEEGIFDNVLNGSSYDIHEIQKPISFTTIIEPTWVPENENEVIELNKEIGKAGRVGIILESVMHRGNDIYFNYDAKPFINYYSGEFLYHAEFNEDGTVSSYFPSNAFNIYDKNNNKIDVGQTGCGPISKFSFGIEIENYDAIKEGFTLEFNGGILYRYTHKFW